MSTRRLWPILRRLWIGTGLTATAVFVTWSVIAYRPDAEARRAAVGDATVRVIHADGMRRFEPVHARRDPSFVFFPGALVDSRAYAPLGRAVARAGYRAIVIESGRSSEPRNSARS